MNAGNMPMEALVRQFSDSSLVFWNGPDAEFATQIEGLVPPGVALIHLDKTPIYGGEVVG